jgi:hypothetical protein
MCFLTRDIKEGGDIVIIQIKETFLFHILQTIIFVNLFQFTISKTLNTENSYSLVLSKNGN